MADQSNEMVRRVADALFKNANYGVPGTVELSRQYESVQARYCGMARDAIEEMRSATPAMMDAGAEPFSTENVRNSSVNSKCGRIWSAMIEAALSHGEVKG